MTDRSSPSQTFVEVIAPDKSRQTFNVARSPFLIGRGEDNNSVQLADARISRRCAAIMTDGSSYRVEDLGNRYGVFVNGVKVQRQQPLGDGDTISFGLDDSYQVDFHVGVAADGAEPGSVAHLMTRIGTLSDLAGPATSSGLSKLNLLLEATSLLHSQLPLDSVLASMLDHAISITHADRGLLIEPDATGVMRIHLARGSKGDNLPIESLNPSQTAIHQALGRQSSIITDDLNLAGLDLQFAESVVIQGLRAVVAIPLYASARAVADTGGNLQRGPLLGVIYLDSRRIAAFSAIDRQILDALAVQAASIIDNARLVERERERQRLEQELSIARNIQQALLPQGLRDFPYLAVTGVQFQCTEVGGDYFDVVPSGEDRTSFMIADVSGKGLGAALVTTMLPGVLSGLTMGAEPVKVFSHFNRFLCNHAQIGRYVTMFMGMIGEDGMLEYMKAGHPSPLLLRKGEVSELYNEGSFPVGLIPEAQFEMARLQLEPDDTLILFSDGITEAQNVNRDLFEVSGLVSALAGKQDLPVEILQHSVLDAVRDFTRGAPPSDDITLLVVRYRATPPEPRSTIGSP